MSTTTILTLPDDIFHLIFARITLHDLVRVGFVSTRFRIMQQAYSQTRRTLSLAFGAESLKLIQQSCFTHRFLDKHFSEDELKTVSPEHVHGPASRIEQLSPQECHVLSHLFSHITMLDFAQDRRAYSDWTLVFALLSRAKNLKILNVKILFGPYELSSIYSLLNNDGFSKLPSSDTFRLFYHINRLSSLKRLTLELHGLNLTWYYNVLPILPPKLEQFYIGVDKGFCMIHKLFNTIQDQDEFTFAKLYEKLTHLGVYDYDNMFIWLEICSIPPQMIAKFSHFGTS